jgi:D-sedoheptulose 7-phosphate isomerase
MTNETADAAADWESWLDDYDARYQAALATKPRKSLVAFRDLALEVKAAGRKLILAGNGASASIASHGRVDFSKQGKVRCLDLNEPNLITAYANDFGYENWVARGLATFADPGDAVVLISSSGRSKNLVNAAAYARENGMKVVAFTGFAPDNPLRQLADIDFWLDSRAYNVIECTHMIWLTTVVDMLVGKAEYGVT